MDNSPKCGPAPLQYLSVESCSTLPPRFVLFFVFFGAVVSLVPTEWTTPPSVYVCFHSFTSARVSNIPAAAPEHVCHRFANEPIKKRRGMPLRRRTNGCSRSLFPSVSRPFASHYGSAGNLLQVGKRRPVFAHSKALCISCSGSKGG